MNGQKIKNSINYFFAHEYFTDALRITLSIVLPVGFLFYFNQPQVAIATGLGALLISSTDIPGTIKEKFLTFIISITLFSVVPVVTSLLLFNPWITAAVILVFTFVLSLLNAYGFRFSLIGTATIILMIFILGFKPVNVLQFCGFIIAGGVWYYIISLLQSVLWPFRSMQHAVGECLKATAAFLEAKSPFYNLSVPLKSCYSNIIVKHAQVSDKQEHMRNLVLKDKMVTGIKNAKGQSLLKITSRVIDLYEQVTAIHYDYEKLREQLKFTGALELIVTITKLMANDLNTLGENLNANKVTEPDIDFLKEMEFLKSRFHYIINKEDHINMVILKKLEININDVFQQIQDLKAGLLNQDAEAWETELQPDYNHFFNRQQFNVKQLKVHLNFKSPVFRFSLRLAAACLFAYALTRFLPLGNYSYWILLTIVVVMKPGFSLTRTRNTQRLLGTIIGIAAGLLLLATVKVVAVQLFFSVVFLLGFFTFNRINYAVSVVFLTTMVIICLDVYSNHHTIYIYERILDTVIGCGIALSASYLFPVWEAQKLNNIIKEVLEVNINYLEKLVDKLSGRQINITEYKLSRKNVFVKLATLSTAIQNMLLEPQKISFNINNVHHFQVLAHQLYGTVASFFITDVEVTHTAGDRVLARQAINNLKDCLQNLYLQNGIAYKRIECELFDLIPLDKHNDEHGNSYQIQLLLNITAELRNQFQASMAIG